MKRTLKTKVIGWMLDGATGCAIGTLVALGGCVSGPGEGPSERDCAVGKAAADLSCSMLYSEPDEADELANCLAASDLFYLACVARSSDATTPSTVAERGFTVSGRMTAMDRLDAIEADVRARRLTLAEAERYVRGE